MRLRRRRQRVLPSLAGSRLHGVRDRNRPDLRSASQVNSLNALGSRLVILSHLFQHGRLQGREAERSDSHRGHCGHCDRKQERRHPRAHGQDAERLHPLQHGPLQHGNRRCKCSLYRL